MKKYFPFPLSFKTSTEQETLSSLFHSSSASHEPNKFSLFLSLTIHRAPRTNQTFLHQIFIPNIQRRIALLAIQLHPSRQHLVKIFTAVPLDHPAFVTPPLLVNQRDGTFLHKNKGTVTYLKRTDILGRILEEFCAFLPIWFNSRFYSSINNDKNPTKIKQFVSKDCSLEFLSYFQALEGKFAYFRPSMPPVISSNRALHGNGPNNLNNRALLGENPTFLRRTERRHGKACAISQSIKWLKGRSSLTGAKRCINMASQ